MTTDLIPIENPQPSALFVPGGLESILTRIEADARAMVPDISTAKGRGTIASLASKVAKAKTYLDGLGKDYTADLKRQTGAVDAERKAMRERLDALKAEVRRPLDEWEQIEKDRVEAIKARLLVFGYEVSQGLPSAVYANGLAEVEAIAVDDSFAEFRDEAQQAKDACLYRLSRMHTDAKAREEEQARQEAEAEAARAKAQQEREERIAREAAERATREAQAKAEADRVAAAKAQAAAIEAQRLAVEQAERKAREAEESARHEAAMAKARAEAAVEQERARSEAERVAKEQAEAKRQADMAHRDRIHKDIILDVEDVMAGWTCMNTSQLIDAIDSGKIRHVRIIY